MSRLESFIRRMQAQHICIDWAIAEIRNKPGYVLELGLGNGRTFDHLREAMPERKIYVFDRQIAAHPKSIPFHDYIFLGDVTETLIEARKKLGEGSVILAHIDLGSGDEDANQNLISGLLPMLLPLLKPEALILSDQSLPTLTRLPEPPGIRPGRYFIYKNGDK